MAALLLTWTPPATRIQPPFMPSFDNQVRSVTQWERQSIASLDLKPLLAQKLKDMAKGNGAPPNVPRCIKLNNFWCIKGKGWAGQLASDDEGHAAFASALAGTAAAARLIQRYYVEFGRISAFAIVSHWAPAQCFAGIAGVVSHADAPFGIGRTLRARWLAKHQRRVISRMAKASTRKAHPSFCIAGVVRVDNYAAAVFRGIAPDAKSDLHLFSVEGAPTPNLSRLMENMAAVEIGPLRVSAALVSAGIAQLLPVLSAKVKP